MQTDTRFSLDSLDPLLATKLSLLPSETFNLYGCTHCEWRGCQICPYYEPALESSSVVSVTSTDLPTDGICGMRVHWLLTLVPNYKTKPSLTRFQLDFAKSMGMVRMRKEFHRLEQLEREMELIADDEEYDMLRKRARDYSYEWFRLWKSLCTLEDEQIGRDTPKNINLNQVSLKPSDVFKMIQDGQKKIDDLSNAKDGEILD